MSRVEPPTPRRPPLWRRLIGFNLLDRRPARHRRLLPRLVRRPPLNAGRASATSPTPTRTTSRSSSATSSASLGFLIGLGFANYPFARLRGYPPSLREKETQGIGRYFGLCTDHKVVGIQYLVGIGLFFFIGGLNAMLIRIELLHPEQPGFPAGQYLTLVGHARHDDDGDDVERRSSARSRNYFVPLMIGARRMAFPRIEALTFWLLMAAGVILTTTIFFGGFPTGWTGYQPLNNQANAGMDSYIVFFALVGISMTLLGLNMIATIMTMRAPGLTWSRLPIFVLGRALRRRC